MHPTTSPVWTWTWMMQRAGAGRWHSHTSWTFPWHLLPSLQKVLDVEMTAYDRAVRSQPPHSFFVWGFNGFHKLIPNVEIHQTFYCTGCIFHIFNHFQPALTSARYCQPLATTLSIINHFPPLTVIPNDSEALPTYINHLQLATIPNPIAGHFQTLLVTCPTTANHSSPLSTRSNDSWPWSTAFNHSSPWSTTSNHSFPFSY